MSGWIRYLCIAALSVGCIADDEAGSADEEYGMEGPLEPTPPPGKEDSENRRGLLVATNTSRTQVWTARNAWEDIDTPAAKRAGLAWSADSGLNWDQKYQAWIASLQRTSSDAGWYDTFTLTTPWGKSLPSPHLECAEMALFLRVTFAAWYELPLFFEAVDSTGKRLYFGHNGVRTSTGRYASSPEFAIVYKDYGTTVPATWPKDATLRGRKLWGGEDSQPFLGAGAVFGTYLDEIHLNKRAGYFTAMVINYLGSVNVADSANTYNIVPESIRPGDVLIERWQRNGIGHTVVVKDVTEIGEGNKDVTAVSGSMPRRQGKWENGVASKGYFTSEYSGGEGTNEAGDEYAKLGGGLKRFRVTKNVGGYWTNTWMRADEAHWINSTDYPRLAARPARFESMLGQVSPEQLRTELLAQIADARRHLQSYPASCSARERRERAFDDLYDLSERHFGTARAQVDVQFRDLSDYVFAELEYAQSKTCCWNSSTTAMHEIIMEFARREQDAADQAGECRAPTPFMNDNGYGRWADLAATLGRGAEWRAWTEDETCAQKNVASDTQRAHAWTDWCELPEDGGGGGACTDALEPNESSAAADAVTAGSRSLQLCSGDVDWFSVASAATVTIEFSHAAGDLDMAAYSATGTQLGMSQGTGNSEQLSVPAGARIKVYGYNGATGAYTLRVQ
jgi:hypothetical protein